MTPPVPAIDPARLAAVDAARLQWIRKLVDLSRRNNLLYFRDLQVGTLDLSKASPEVMQRLLQSNKPGATGVKLLDLVAEVDAKKAAGSLREIARKAQINFEERGLDTLFLALGLATWKSHDDGRPAAAPVLLVPIDATPIGKTGANWSLLRGGEVRVNDVLVHALLEDHQVTLDPDALLAGLLGDDEGEEFDPLPLFAELQAKASRVPDFAIESRWVLGNFAFQKMAIVKDLKTLGTALASHDIIAGIAGDRGAIASAAGDRVSVDPSFLDEQPPDNEFLIRDADSSQHRAIEATLRGQNGVISGPPGTGKSQTIANLVAELVARGKTVLFVAEKRAALDVVLNRLDAADLGHLCLDCHGAELTRRRVAEQLQQSLDRLRDAPIPDFAAVHKRLTARRTTLNAHARLINSPLAPWGLSPVQIYGKLLQITESALTTARVPATALQTMTPDIVESALDDIDELVPLADLLTGSSSSPWLGAALRNADEARTAVERVRSLDGGRWLGFAAALSALTKEADVDIASIDDVSGVMGFLTTAQSAFETVTPAAFAADLDSLVATLQPAASLWARLWAFVTDGAYRAAIRTARAFCVAPKVTAPNVLAAMVLARTTRDGWRQLSLNSTVVPKVLSTLAEAARTWRDVQPDVTATLRLFPERVSTGPWLESVGLFVGRLARDGVTPARVVRLHELSHGLEQAGFGGVLSVLATGNTPEEEWSAVLKAAWLQSCLEEAQLRHPELPAFSGRRHDDIAKEFRSLDIQRIQLAVQRVQREHAVKAVGVLNANAGQDQLVRREAQKKSRHLPLRQLFVKAPDVLVALRPCWMASPLSVSQLMPGDRQLFDVVIFDEASQVLPEDAITSLLRGKRAVIAGDRKQLPPTTFFASGDLETDSDDDATAGFQSILDVMSSFLEPAWHLDWHYRSRDEALIAFSNHEIYGGRLVTFPGPEISGAIRHVLVQHQPGQGAQQTSVAAEVRRVVELIREHARDRPDESLGVITMGIEHARRIEMALDDARFMDPNLESLLSPDVSERFFVKNLERVQGDERDAIILSIGYGKNDAGQLVYRFGPLLQDGGERRLNVAITRARRSMTVVSSFSHEDVDPNYPKQGVKLLRGYLEFAASGGRRFARAEVTDTPLNAFEESVAEELRRHGLKVIGQVGSSRFRIDLVAMHPEQEGRFVLAIECDGATYHSAPTARDRDRLRQQQLEALGWRFHRIWSTDWFLRKEEEVQRVLKAYEAALKAGDQLPDEIRAVERPPAPQAQQPARARDPLPRILAGRKITEYTRDELIRMVRWVQSDGILLTNDQILEEVMRTWGFRRRGTKIVEAIEAAIRAAGVHKPTVGM